MKSLPYAALFLVMGLLVAVPPVTLPARQSAVVPVSNALPSDEVRAEFDGLDAFITGVMQDWKVPGLAVAAIRDGQVVLARGYGYRDVERQQPVTSKTLMAIGSNTKSFTVTLLGMLADEKKLDWDTPVREYLPDFQLHDDVATRLMTPADLVDHRSGLPRHDGMWYGRAFTRKELYDRLRFLEPSASFRQRYQYNNLMFMTAGVLAERLTGQSWDDLIAARIFAPLGMTRSNTSVRQMPHSDDYSLPYLQRSGKVVAVPFRNIDAVAPAGSINSSVEDMMRYIQMHIDMGRHGTTTLLSKPSAMRMQSGYSTNPPSLDPEAPVHPEIVSGGYGLGLQVLVYRGHKLVTHGGGIDGFISGMSWMPHQRLGVMVLTNFSGDNPVPNVVMYQIYDRLLRLAPIDWNSRLRTDLLRNRMQQAERRAKERAEQVPGTSPSHQLADYTGNYTHRAYGTINVSQENGGLVIRLESVGMRLEHFHYDVFRVASVLDPADDRFLTSRVTFSYPPGGRIDRVAIPLEPAVSPIVFTRFAPAAALSTPSGTPASRRMPDGRE
jgi:CubicO group peptidase (beta-lactamase class C family)